MATSRCESRILNSLLRLGYQLKKPSFEPQLRRSLTGSTGCQKHQQSPANPRQQHDGQIASCSYHNHLNQHRHQQRPHQHEHQRRLASSTGLTINRSSVRFSSTSSSSPKVPVSPALQPTTGPLASLANLKRDVSTQAQQQVELLPSEQEANKYSETFRCSEMEIIRCSKNELHPKPSTDKLLFGHAFTDHMFRVDWTNETGWSTPLISKLHHLEVHPAAKVLHYAIQAFEGAKAYRGYDNKIRLFRLDQNIRRLQSSAERLSLPSFDAQELLKCIHNLIGIDQDWIPRSNQHQLTSLYIRPSILGLEPSLGVAGSRKATLYVLLSPAGPYFRTGFKPISLYADPSFVRAWPGGAGNTKLGSNYAPTIMVQKKAEQRGCQQVLWLFDDDMKLTEVGTMNVFVSVRNRETGKLHLITPPLNDGLILPGITRASILELARHWPDVVCEERYVTINELKQLISENRLVEMFGAGTACIVCPISLIQMKNGTALRIPHSDITKPIGDPEQPEQVALTRRLLKAITDIQYGATPHPWAKELFDF